MSDDIRRGVGMTAKVESKVHGIPGQVDRLERMAERAEAISKMLAQRLSPCLVPLQADKETEGCPSDPSGHKKPVGRSNCELADWLSAKSDRLEITLDSLKELHDRIDL